MCYQHWVNRKILFTDGAEHVAKAGGAFWLHRFDNMSRVKDEEEIAADIAYLAHLDSLDYLRNTAPVRITHEALDTLRRVSDRTGEEYEASSAGCWPMKTRGLDHRCGSRRQSVRELLGTGLIEGHV